MAENRTFWLLRWESSICSRSDPCVKINGFGQAEILGPEEIASLFSEGFVKERDRALFGICLYAGARIYDACTLLKGDVTSPRGVRSNLAVRESLENSTE